MDDRISSLLLSNQYNLYLFENLDYEGECVFIKESQPSLGLFGDKASSLIAFGKLSMPWGVFLEKHPQARTTSLPIHSKNAKFFPLSETLPVVDLVAHEAKYDWVGRYIADQSAFLVLTAPSG
jgi:hypothetical protein